MKLQFISDLHLEFYSKLGYEKIRDNILNNKGDSKYIALLGDIGDPMKEKNNWYELLIQDMANNYDNVFVIAGNHEYYSGYPMDVITQKMEDICDIPNVYFMNNKSMELTLNDTKVKIIGTTLWSYIPSDYKSRIEKYINDYRKIYVDDTNLFTIDTSNKLHRKAVEFITSEIKTSEIKTSEIKTSEIKTSKNKNSEIKTSEIIILTHHSPLMKGTSAPQYEGNITNHAFSTDLNYLMKSPVKYWCFGHTHWQTDINCNGVQVMSNPLGYQRELNRNGQTMNYGKFL